MLIIGLLILFSADYWPMAPFLVLYSALGARPMAAGPVRPLGPEGAPPGPGPGPALPRAPGAGPGWAGSRAPSAESRIECQE